MTDSPNRRLLHWNFLLLLSILLLAGETAFAQIASTDLTPEVQTRLAHQFAPILVFHSDELYFPCSPLFEFESGSGELRSLMGSPELRTVNYRRRTLEEKANLATVYYRAFRLWESKDDAVVIEYWFYYVQDTYRARGNILPMWFDGSHPNDLEHIQIVLKAAFRQIAIAFRTGPLHQDESTFS